jgi:NIMA (never in mitosis gene a)-related kinase
VPKAATPTPVPKAAAAETSAAGLRFGGGPPVMENYDSMRKIGRGNYGTVYLARDTRNGKHYCLKQIQMETYSAEERANAQQEVEVLRTLDHPGIVRYREHFLHGDSLCVVMTYCEGGDLAATIKRRAKKEDNFTEAEVLDWFVQLVMALHHVHSKKILHRDLKTQNIFITKNLVKLGDFGIAKVMEGSMSAASTVIGTPYYMSPEVCQNQPYSYKSDVWALGCILYEMCALQQAWNGSNLLGLVYKIVQEKYPPLSDDYSEDLRRLVPRRRSLTTAPDLHPDPKPKSDPDHRP